MSAVRVILTVAGIGLLGAAVFGGKRKKKRRKRRLLQPGDHLGLIGDSLAVGIEHQLREVLEPREITLSTNSKGATTAAYWLDKPFPVNTKATLVILGTNDCLYDSPFCEKFGERLAIIAEKIRDGGAVPVFVGMPTMPWESHAAGEARMAKAREEMSQIPESVYLPPPPFEVPRTDEIHPTNEGDTLWSEYIVEQLAGPAPPV